MVVVITGATKGIGRAISEHLAERGHDLAICARSADQLQELKAWILEQTPSHKVITQALDVRHRTSLSDFGKTVLENFGRVDVLINNAGIFVPGKITEESPETFDEVLETNLHSAYFLTKAFLPKMMERKSGHVINMCSVASIQAYPSGGSYAISKHALHGFGKTLREEVREYGIRVTNILPGATWTDSWTGADLPENRLMHARNVAQMVVAAIEMDPNAVLEEIVLRPIEGDV